MTNFGPSSQASSQPAEKAEKLEHGPSKVLFQASHRGQLWKKFGLVGSVAIMGGQPVLAQIDNLPDEIAPPVAAETTPYLAVTTVPTIFEPAVPPAVESPEVEAPVFSAAPEVPVQMAPPQVEAITSQVEVVIPAPVVVPEAVPEAVSEAVVPEAAPEIVPEAFPGGNGTPDVDVVAPTGSEIDGVGTGAEAITEAPTPGVDIVRPSDVVPGEIPTVEELASEYGGVFVDPTEYSEGATVNPGAPDVFVSERSTGCEYKVNAANLDGCGAATGKPSPSAVAGVPGGTAVSGTPGPSINIGPVSISRSGVRFSGVGATTVAGREFYNTVAKPLVELQAGESFVFPLASPSPITSLFGWRWHPIHHDYRFHAGTDMGAPQGTPILATQSGQVSVADYLGGYGLTVILRHNSNTLESRYAHMSHILVQPGEWVEQGEAIGLVGSTGNSTGPHLHFELHQLTSQGWTAISPNEVLRYALANLNEGIGTYGRGPSPLQALNIVPKAQAAVPVKAALPKAVQTETLVTDAPHFRPAQPHAQ